MKKLLFKVIVKAEIPKNWPPGLVQAHEDYLFKYNSFFVEYLYRPTSKFQKGVTVNIILTQVKKEFSTVQVLLIDKTVPNKKRD